MPDPARLDALEDGAVEYLAVRVERDLIAQLQDGAPVVRISPGEVEELALRRGTTAERPVIQTVFALALLLGGLVGLWFFHGNDTELLLGGTKAAHLLGASLLLAIPLGAWLLIGVLRRGVYLAVTTRGDLRRLSFSTRPEPATLERFLREAERILRRPVRRELP